MRRLPDGSGFLIGFVGARDPGFLEWLKYTKRGSARLYVWIWRNYKSFYRISREPGLGPPLGHCKALYLAVRCVL